MDRMLKRAKRTHSLSLFLAAQGVYGQHLFLGVESDVTGLKYVHYDELGCREECVGGPSLSRVWRVPDDEFGVKMEGGREATHAFFPKTQELGSWTHTLWGGWSKEEWHRALGRFLEVPSLSLSLSFCILLQKRHLICAIHLSSASVTVCSAKQGRLKAFLFRRVAMKFADFPIELLGAVTGYLHFLDIYNLWCSGNGALYSKLTSGGVSKLEVKMASNIRPFSWPTFFSTLRLASLSLKDDNVNASIALVTAPMLSNLSNTMKTLKLDCAGAFTALQALLLENPRAWPTLEHLETTIAPIDNIATHVARWPSSLLALKFDTYSTRHLVLDPACLPEHLESLTGDFYKLRNPTNAMFPQSMRKLHLQLGRLVCDPVPLLPDELLEFSVTIIQELGIVDDDADGADVGPPEEDDVVAWAHDSLSKLPRKLEYLDLPLNMYRREDLIAMPPTLVFFGMPQVSLANIDVLPASLEFCYAFSDISHPLKVDTCRSLPKRLTQLIVEAKALPHLSSTTADVSVTVDGSNSGLKQEMDALGTEKLPPHITALTIEEASEFPWEALPKCLTSLKLSEGSITERFVASLPNTLKELILPTASLPDEAHMWTSLPPLLEYLHLSSISSPSKEIALWLPRTLLYLKVFNCDMSSLEWLEGLPSGLRLLRLPLDIESLFEDSPASWRIPLPPSLSFLQIRCQFPEEETETSSALRNIIASLPPTLVELTIDNAFSRAEIPYSARDLEGLPKRLTKLSVPDNEELDPEHLSTLLPLSLTSAKFGPRELCVDYSDGRAVSWA